MPQEPELKEREVEPKPPRLDALVRATEEVVEGAVRPYTTGPQ
jgi:hypothetical protein